MSAVYQTLLVALNLAHKALGDKSPINVSLDKAEIIFDGKQLVRVSDEDIQIVGISYGAKLLTAKKEQNFPNEKFTEFINAISEYIVRLNHVGIGYAVYNLENETESVKQDVLKAGLYLYEEPTDVRSRKWLFIGDAAQWEMPLFELVLRKGEEGAVDAWTPHFQIDFDTTLSSTDMRIIASKHFGDKFISWTMNIPEIGTVLEMGILGEISGVKIVLGLGTDKRGTQFHREKILKKLV